MCGLVGMIFNSTNGCLSSDAQVFEELLYLDALRGEDSTGIAALYNTGEMQIVKDACEANFFRYSDEFKQVKKDLVSKGKIILGHNRKKTIGKITSETAHPFLINDRYAFTHNGTLIEHKKLADTEVDSEALGIHLTACNGNLEKLETALADVQGAYACAWIDQTKEVAYLLRNAERPLYLAKTTLGYVYASESGMIYAICGRNRIKVDSIEVVDAETLYTFTTSSTYGIDLKKEKLNVVKKASPPGTHTQHRGTKAGGNMGTRMEKVVTDSKNSYKRFRKDRLGTVIPFYVDDFVEKNYPKQDGEWFLFGKNDEIPNNHLISGVVTGHTIISIEEDYLNNLAYGTIMGVEYDSKAKMMKILVGSIKRYIPSRGKCTYEASTVKH